MTIQPLPIMGSYDKQRFPQFSPEDSANWSLIQAQSGKKKTAMYPTMGRRHINYLGLNRLIFSEEPRAIFRTVNYWYVVVLDDIFQIDMNYNQFEIANGSLSTLKGNVFFDYLIVGNITFAVFVDGQNIYIYRELIKNPDGTTVLPEFTVVTDPNAPPQPTFVKTFGNRIVVSTFNSSLYTLSRINLDGGLYDPNTVFTNAGSALFNQATGIIKQFAVLNNTLYIMTDFTTDIWSNIPSTFQSSSESALSTFPWKQSSSYNWDYGIADPLSLDVDFHRMVWLAQNKNGLVQVMVSDGSLPIKLSTQAINVLFQKNAVANTPSPFLAGNSNGFLYQYEDTIYYRLSAGNYGDFGILDQIQSENSIEFNFDTNNWSRVIETNGERCRIQKHIFYNTQHLVTVANDNTIYEMSGQFYSNEITNPNNVGSSPITAYISEPFRYERVTPIISQDDYSEFQTDYVQIDFVFGDMTFINTQTPFDNTVYMIDEDPNTDGTPKFIVSEDNPDTFIIQEGTNTPDLNSQTYNDLFKPHIELYFSNDGGINYFPADVLEFSQLGVYQWRMRWYQLGTSRNRVYKLICVSPAPIVILGGTMDVRRMSGGAD